MTKWQMTKILMLGIAHLATGVALIIGTLIALVPIMDALIKLYPDEAMPLWLSLIPLLITFVGVGWGAFFIWKSCMSKAPAIAFYFIGKSGYKMLALHHISIRRRKFIGALLVLVGLIMILTELIPAGIRAFPEPPMSLTHPFIALIGIATIVISMAIAGYDPTEENIKVEGDK